jgi:tetratricopeptide (TPR) repeat protein
MSSVNQLVSLRALALSVVAFGLLACAPDPRLREDPEDFREEVARLERQIAENPEAAGPLRDLGAIYVRTKRPDEGYRYLEKALSREPNDPKTLFYMGVASERLGRTQEAQQLYRRFPKVPKGSRFRSLMKGRYQWLLRQEVKERMAKMVQREDTLADDVSPRTVAVFPLSYQGDNEQYAPLGRGLAEMISTDLAQIDELQLVERVRIEALLDELQLAESQYVEPATAPRAGRLLGAGRLVGGAYSVLDDENLRIETALADIQREGALSDIESRSDALEQLFELKTEVVFDVADQFGIELTAEERSAIEKVPTRNLQAFLAYSRGLERRARGDFERAAEAFRRATELDPEFSLAAQRLESAEALAPSAGSLDRVLLAAAQIGVRPSTINLTDSRLRALTRMTGFGLVTPGARQPGAEFQTIVLDDPPPPPPQGQ